MTGYLRQINITITGVLQIKVNSFLEKVAKKNTRQIAE